MVVQTMGSSIRNYYYNLKKDEALKIANSIAIDLSHTAESLITINQLLEDKLITILKTADLTKDDYSNEYLKKLANFFELDEIYVYDTDGVIKYSSSGKYIGWTSYEGHPVQNFIDGNQDIFVEDIRKDSESEMYYKYGYIKHADGTFIQIGILAEKVNNLLESVRLQRHIEEIANDESILLINAIDKDYSITASTNIGYLGSKLLNKDIINDINSNRLHESFNTTNGFNLYEIFVPLTYGSDKVMAFQIQYSMDEIGPIIRKNILIGVVGLIIVYLSLIFAIFLTFKRDRKLVRLAYFDSLTNLPNLLSLKEILWEDLKNNKDNKAILMIRCDNLSLNNATFGYDYGDLILKEISSRIKTLDNKNIKSFKFTAEKFVMYINNYGKNDEINNIINLVKNKLDSPFTINNITEHVVFKIGIMEYSVTDKSIDEILQDATIALKHATAINDNISFYNEEMELEIKREESVEKELRIAIAQEDISCIYLVYQPIIDAKTDRIDGFEALARMSSKQFGFVSPVEFIDIAERKQLIIPLSNLILKQACSFTSELLKIGFNHIRVAVNISIIHLLQEDFVSSVLDIIEETGIKGENLELELTETVLMENFQIGNERLKELKNQGISIALDDFGTGYSSFDRIIELNVDTLKIDKYFIDGITNSDKDFLITRDLISIAHRLGLKTVAEGVEIQEQKDYLLEHHCDKLQGYLFSKPVPKDEAIKLLSSN